MLQFQIVAGSGTVDFFDGHSWTHQSGKLQFFDTNYAMSGWHEMSEFAVEYYDGVGYDGEPLKVVDGWRAQPADPEEANGPFVLNTLTATGANSKEPPPGTVIDEWVSSIYGQWSEEFFLSYEVPNPSPDYRPSNVHQPLKVAFVSADDLVRGTELPPEWTADQREQAPSIIQNYARDCLETDAIYISFTKDQLNTYRMVDAVCKISKVFDQPIQILGIQQHGSLGVITIGNSVIHPDNYVDSSPWIPSESRVEFAILKNVMADDAQIQFYHCKLAGIGCYPPYFGGDLGKASYGARAMLGDIAQLTGAKVFASSDLTSFAITFPEDGPPLIHPGDTCLEFAINPDRKQVDCMEMLTLFTTPDKISWQKFDRNDWPYEGDPGAWFHVQSESGLGGPNGRFEYLLEWYPDVSGKYKYWDGQAWLLEALG